MNIREIDAGVMELSRVSLSIDYACKACGQVVRISEPSALAGDFSKLHEFAEQHFFHASAFQALGPLLTN